MRRKQMRRNELPDTCLSTLPSTGQLIVLKHGVRGYYRSEWDTGNRAENRDIADSHNRRRGITDIQETAMMAGSMFGWDTPGADPQWYLDHAKYGNSAMIKGYIKDPIMSVYYPVIGFLLRYKILGREKMYLPVSALSKELLGARSQFVMQPDLVCGVPMMPVKAQQAQNGSYTMELESGSYVIGEIINADYKITARVCVGNAEFALGEHPKAPAPFVTWQRNCKNDEDGPPNFFWGHYGADRAAMIEPVNIMGVIAFPEPDKSKRRIRFIDPEYNTLFYIPDGGSIVMTRLDGGSVIRFCTYIDDYHTLVGSNVYHICEFAEMAQRTGTVYEPLDPIQQPADAGCYEIYQIDNVAKVDYAFMRCECAKGKLRAAHYRKAFAGVLAPNMTLEELYRKHNADTRPFYRQMRSLSESDVIVVKRGSKRNAYYVDSVGFQEVPSFLKGLQKLKERGEAR